MIAYTEMSYAEGIWCIVNILKCDLASWNEEKLELQDHQICITCV